MSHSSSELVRHAPARQAPVHASFFRADPVDRIALIKAGILASEAKIVIGYVSDNQGEALRALDIAPATLNRKIKSRERLASAESERVLGVARLLGQVQAMVEEAGEPQGFDAGRWLQHWLGEPLPALGNRRPRDLLDTIEGQSLVSATLARIGSGAYV
ncbi:DUF2384 domain-containing protein [Acetobacteraceae bacterium KSS8]|uniref:DUF2384 domain-containing protein n=1 Tax=Endosaccharibacter trunci TaxID=2812733 RepID=A0ABT1W3A2_9PROT|nr:DUF2384 domain-containing protein [Acetobacteraceae bacterium KSS8]